MKLRNAISVLLVVAVALFTGCSSRESRVVGIWIEEGQNAATTEGRFEFFSDKTVVLSMEGTQHSGTWSMLTDGRMKADIPVLFGKITVLGELQRRTLVLDIDGKRATFVRVSPREAREASAAADAEQNRKVCINNLRQLDAVKDKYCLEYGGTDGQVISWEQVSLYIRDVDTKIYCPSAKKGARSKQNYKLNPISVDPVCLVQPGTVRIPIISATQSDDIGHHRSVATLAV